MDSLVFPVTIFKFSTIYDDCSVITNFELKSEQFLLW